jgi:hypothetical protein
MNLGERVDADFARARRRAFLRRICGRPRGGSYHYRLPCFQDAEARVKLAKAKAARDEGLIFGTENMTLKEYLDRWLDDLVRAACAPPPTRATLGWYASTSPRRWVRSS